MIYTNRSQVKCLIFLFKNQKIHNKNKKVIWTHYFDGSTTHSSWPVRLISSWHLSGKDLRQWSPILLPQIDWIVRIKQIVQLIKCQSRCCPVCMLRIIKISLLELRIEKLVGKYLWLKNSFFVFKRRWGNYS